MIGNYIKAVATAVSRTTAQLMKTGQTVSYRTGDDGDLERGRNTSFTVLAENNPFGNTNRFTDELGTQLYLTNIVIDWSTYNGSTVLGWYRLGDNGVVATWNQAIDLSLALSIGTFTTGWRLANMMEYMSICNFSVSRFITYSPINAPNSNNSYWSSTTNTGGTTQAYRFDNFGLGSSNAKTGTAKWLAVRTFTVTGTTLS
jgi:hypothetical protein